MAWYWSVLIDVVVFIVGILYGAWLSWDMFYDKHCPKGEQSPHFWVHGDSGRGNLRCVKCGRVIKKKYATVNIPKEKV